MPETLAPLQPCRHGTYSPGCSWCEVDYLQRHGETLTPGDCCRRCRLWSRFCRCGKAQQLGPDPAVFRYALLPLPGEELGQCPAGGRAVGNYLGSRQAPVPPEVAPECPSEPHLPCTQCGAAVVVAGGAMETPTPETFCEVFKGECVFCGALLTFSVQGRRDRV
jgi:hypothetical protein